MLLVNYIQVEAGMIRYDKAVRYQCHLLIDSLLDLLSDLRNKQRQR